MVGVVLGSIGLLLGLPQTSAAAQGSAPILVPDRDAGWVRRFESWLDPSGRAEWSQGLDLARRAGPSVGGLLRRLQERASDHRSKILLLGAVVAAEGADSAGLLLERARPRRRSDAQLRERLAAAFLASELPRESVDPEVWSQVLLDRGEEVSVRIAAGFAIGSRRGERIAEEQRRAAAAEDPGLAAAFALVFDEIDAPWGVRWFDGEPTAAYVVRRAMFLGAHATDAGEARAALVESALGASGFADDPLRLAAALSLAGSRDPDAWLRRLGSRVDPVVVAVLALDPGFAEPLAGAGRLVPLPELHGATVRRRMALGMATALAPAALGASRETLRRDPVAGPVVCLGVARRLLQRAAPPTPEVAESWIQALPDLPELEWVRIACGLPPAAELRSFDDRALDRAYRVFRSRGHEGLPRSSAAQVVEEALARLQALPGSLRRELEHQLLWELIVGGSDHGVAVGGHGRDTGERYHASGLPRGDVSYPILDALDEWFREHGGR